MSDIVISIKNYKLIKDFEQEYADAKILLVTGKNEVGKSSLIRAFIENMTARSVTPDPVTTGEKEGSKTFTIPDKEGNPVVIHHEFSQADKKGTFYAIDHLGKKVKDVTKIRELVGIFEELPIDVFYTLQQTAPGRKKIIENYFYPLMSSGEMTRIKEIDTRTNKGGEDYDKRTALNQEIGYVGNQLKASQLNEEEKVLLEEIPQIEKELAKLKTQQLSAANVSSQHQNRNERLATERQKLVDIARDYKETNEYVAKEQTRKKEEIKELQARMSALETNIKELDDYKVTKTEAIHTEEKAIQNKIKAFEEMELPERVDTETIANTIKEAEEIRDKAITAKTKKETYSSQYKVMLAKQEEAQDLEQTIAALRDEKKDILSNSKLPQGLSIDGDDFSWNGFSFTDSQIAKSSALLVIAEILCKISTAKIVYIGEKALFDKDRFKKLVEIAEKHGKIPVLEQVIDDQNEIKVITEIYE